MFCFKLGKRGWYCTASFFLPYLFFIKVFVYICFKLNRTAMKEYVLLLAGNQDDPYLNQGGRLELYEGDKITELCSFTLLTAKGWESKKKLYEDIDVIKWEESNIAIITKECADTLVAKYSNIKAKYYTPPHMRGVSKEKVLCDYIFDPHCTA